MRSTGWRWQYRSYFKGIGGASGLTAIGGAHQREMGERPATLALPSGAYRRMQR